MARIEITTEACKSCSYCVISCPKKCLEIGEKVNSKGYLYATQDLRTASDVRCAPRSALSPQ